MSLHLYIKSVKWSDLWFYGRTRQWNAVGGVKMELVAQTRCWRYFHRAPNNLKCNQHPLEFHRFKKLGRWSAIDITSHLGAPSVIKVANCFCQRSAAFLHSALSALLGAMIWFLASLGCGAALFLYMAVMGPSQFHRNDFVGLSYRFLISSIPRYFMFLKSTSSVSQPVWRKLCILVLGNGLTKRLSKFFDYLINQRNLFVQVIVENNGTWCFGVDFVLDPIICLHIGVLFECLEVFGRLVVGASVNHSPSSHLVNPPQAALRSRNHHFRLLLVLFSMCHATR